jgi:hypothetical protein
MRQQLARRQQLDASGDELDCQRQAVQPATQLGDHGGVGVGHCKIGLHGLAALLK